MKLSSDYNGGILMNIKKIIFCLFLLMTIALLGLAENIIIKNNLTQNLILCTDPVILETNLIMEEILHFNPGLADETKATICRTIQKESYHNRVDPFLVTAMIATESSFRPKVISPCSARGLMQISSTVVEIYGIKEPFDINQNIYAGTRYFHTLLQNFINEDLALAAYNAGPTRITKVGRIPEIKETRNYIKRIRNIRTRIKNKWRFQMLTRPVLTYHRFPNVLNQID
jgi:hypothetical protein